MNTVSLDLPEIAFFGRSLAEYEKQFSIRTAELAGHRVLDCAAGPSSFAAEASCCGVDVVAVDPLYNRNETALRMNATAARHRMFAQMRARPELFTMRTFASFDAAEADRRNAAGRFLADFYGGVANGRYVAGALPRLPFADAAFDLVLCGHLLFVYEAKLDLAFHLAAALELCRVSRGDVRIHPLVNTAGEQSRFVAPLRAALDERGLRNEIVDLDYGFFRGATTTLIVKREPRAG